MDTTGRRPSTGNSKATSFSLVVLLAAVATAFFLESTRVYLSFIFFNIDQPSRYDLIVPAGLAVPAIGLGGVLIRLAGIRSTIVIAALGLAASRLVIQFWQEPDARSILSSAAVTTWGWLALGLVLARRDAVALGLVAGMGLDLAVRIGFQTVDLPWSSGTAAHVLTVLLVCVLVGAAVLLWLSRDVTMQDSATIPLFAIGPALLVYHLVTGSIGLVETNANAGFLTAAGVLAAGMALGIAFATLIIVRPLYSLKQSSRLLLVLPLALTGGLALWLAWMRDGAWTLAGFVVFSAVFAPLLAHAVASPPVGETGHSLAAKTIWFTAGIVFQAALLLVYFFVQNVTLAFGSAYAAVAVCALGAARVRHEPVRSVRCSVAIPAAMIAVLVLTTLLQVMTWSSEKSEEPLAGTITVMTYNIQAGFSANDEFSLEAIARTIEQADPDVVILQEVARGWPFTTGIDQLLWLTRRLDMQFVFGDSDSVRLWGVAVLTRSPIRDVLHVGFNVPDFDRGVTAALVATESDDALWVYGTHFAAPRWAEAARLAEGQQLLDVWDERAPAVIAGDFNAEPDSPTIDLLQRAGLVDVGQEYDTEEATFHDNRRIDHLLVTPGIEVLDVWVIDSDTSDHKPLVARIRLEDGGTR